ncbi:MAG: flagellar export protein FliJ [Verrucomicrobiales bacterium]|nr:flagellar export protein FliJ [Verrucomicrobiales bacterium]
MKKFRFTLQALLTVRQRQEHLAMERYAAALAQRRRAMELLAIANTEVVDAAQAWQSRVNGGLMAAELVQRAEHLRVLEFKRNQAAVASASAERAVDPALNAMLEARRQRELVEQCEQQQRLRHQREAARQDSKVQDELAQRRVAPALVWRGNE